MVTWIKRDSLTPCLHQLAVHYNLCYYSSPVRKNVSSKLNRFVPARPHFDTNHRVNFSTPTYCQSATSGLLAFCVSPLFFNTQNQKEFRMATVAIFRTDI